MIYFTRTFHNKIHNQEHLDTNQIVQAIQPDKWKTNIQIQKKLVKDHVRTICKLSARVNRSRAKSYRSWRNKHSSTYLSTKKAKVFAQCHQSNQNVQNSTFEKVS